MFDIPPVRNWLDQPTAGFAKLAHRETVAILPVAAVEQHGPHLPVGVDFYIMQGLLRELCQSALSTDRFLILPVQAVGKSNEHLPSAGTLSLPASVALDTWVQLGAAVQASGLRNLLILSSHGGNRDVSNIAARELRVRYGLHTGAVHWSDFGFPEGLYNGGDIACDIHGGDIETSLMLYFRPDLVDLSQAEDFENRLASRLAQADSAAAPIKLGWRIADVNPKGAAGDATRADGSKGRSIAQHQALMLLRALRAFAAIGDEEVSYSG